MGGGTLIVNLVLVTFFSELISGWLPLESEVPMGHSLVEFRVREVAPPTMRTDVLSYRLPKTISPIHYDLEIRPILDDNDPDQWRAPGQVKILIKCLQPTSTITLHAKYLEINFQSITIQNVGKASPVRLTGFNIDDDERAFLTLFLDRDLALNGEYLLKIPFAAWIADPWYRQSGLYRAEYKLKNGTKKWLAVTQFQKAYAREAFPCFDEPSFLFKATFSVKIGRKTEGYQSFSNMEQIGAPVPIPNMEGWVYDVYNKTMKMPVYTLAFVVTMDYVAEESPDPKIPMRTWVPNSLMTETSVKFSARASSHILKYFEELFEFPYMLNKLDNLAANMHLWAMESIGLVIYRPWLLVWTEEESTAFEKWNSAALIAHEYAHHWFGNLVTCEWWDDFWLQEGFARYFQFVGAQFSGEDFRATDRYVLDITQWSMILDEGPDSVPVHSNETNKVIYQPFQIEYDKAGSLIRMMQTFLTQNTFLKGLRLYLKRHQYNNTVQDDLFQAMTDQAVADKTMTQYTVKEIMDTWTRTRVKTIKHLPTNSSRFYTKTSCKVLIDSNVLSETGFPLIRVSRADHDTLYLTQHRFIVHPSSKITETSMWYVPIWYVTQSKPTFDGDNSDPVFWMDKDTIITYFHVKSTDEWIIINPEARGYYRTIYDDHLTQLIISQLELNHTVLNFATRSQLIDDYFRSAHARFISIKYAMDLTWYLSKEDDLIVWTTVFNNFRSIFTRLVDTQIITSFRKYLLRLLLDPLKRLGVKQPANESASNTMLRGQFLDWICALENELCINYAEEFFAEWKTNPARNPIPTDIQPQMYCAAVASSIDYKVHSFLVQHYKMTKSTRQKSLVIRALACDQTTTFLQKFIERSVMVNDIDIDVSQHGRLLLESVVRNHLGRNLTLQFMKTHFKEITRVHGTMAIPRIIAALAPYASSKGKLKLDNEIISFISMYLRQPNISDYVESSLQSSAQMIVDNSYWMEYFFYDVKDWLTLHIKL